MNEWGAGNRAGRLCGGILAVIALVATAACGGSVTSPGSTVAPITPGLASPTPWLSESPATPTLTPNPSGGLPTFATNFDLAMGTAARLAPASDAGAAAGGAINNFGLALLRRLNPKGNLVFSPASIALALAMVEPGARGNTLAQLDALLGGLGSELSGRELQALLGHLYSDNIWLDTSGDPYFIDDTGQPVIPDVVLDPSQPQAAQLTLSNQTFFQKGMHLENAYLDALSSRFGAGAGLLDYMADPDAARQTINKWVSDRTNGLIPEILQPGDVDRATRFDLVNTVYLAAHWATEFDPTLTKARPFYRPDGSSVKVPMMADDTETAEYEAGPGWRAITMGYQNGTAMTVVVPANMSSFVASLDQKRLESIFATNKTVYVVHLWMPRFSVDTRADLTPTLSAMGMSDAFDHTRADLSGIDGDRDLFLTNVIHQANITVDERGTVAAAATVVGGGMGAAGPPPPETTFHVDHPFLYFIRDLASGTILFAGRVDDPSLGG